MDTVPEHTVPEQTVPKLPKWTKATSNEYMAAYMRQYRIDNLEHVKKQDRNQYHLNKFRDCLAPLTPEQLEHYKYDLKNVCKILTALALAKKSYPELLLLDI